MHSNPLLGAALSYAAIGWHILPCWWIVEVDGVRSCACGDAECPSPGKHPIGRLVRQGQNNATCDYDQIKTWWSAYPQANIAAYLEPSRLAVIDIDPRNGGIETIDNIEAKYGKLHSDLTQFTGGGGEHRAFQLPAGHFTLPGTLGRGVDVKLNGYIMLEPSNHISGGQYLWEASSDPRDGGIASPMPDWLRDLGRGVVGEAPIIPAMRMVDPKQIADLRSALGALDSDDYKQWVDFGNALVELGQAGFDLWDEWSQKSEKYDRRVVIQKWRSFRSGKFQIESIFFEAQRLGWINPVLVTPTLPEQPAPMVATEAMIESAAKDEPPSFSNVPPEFLALPGEMGECMAWMTRTAQRPQPLLSMVATISLFATALSQKIASPTGLRTNLYLVGVAGTSAGKDHGRKCISRALQAAQLDSLLGGDEIASGAGLLARVHRVPRTLFQLDEFGLMLQAMRSKNAGVHLSSIVPYLMKLYGSTDSIYRGAEYADQKVRARQDIEYPCVNLHATTTPDQFFSALGSADVTSGALNRLLVIVCPDRIVPMRESEPEIPPASVVEWLQAVQRIQCGTFGGLLPNNPITLAFEPGARRLSEEFSQWRDSYYEQHADQPQIVSLWGRAHEAAIKMAMIHSMASHSDPKRLDDLARNGALKITETSIRWGVAFVRHFMGEMERELVARMGDSDFDILVKECIRHINRKGKKGLTNRELGQFCPAYGSKEPRVQDAIHVAILRREAAVQVVYPPASGRGKSRTAWVATQFIEEEKDD